MKRLVLALLIVLAPAFLLAQNSAVQKIFDKYGEKDGFTTVMINSGLLKMAADFTDDEDMDVLNGIDFIKILAVEDEANNHDLNFYAEVVPQLKRDAYEELMTVKSSDADVLFLVKKSGNDIRELLLVVGGEDDNALIYIGGNINLKDVAKLGKSMNIQSDAFAHLEELDK